MPVLKDILASGLQVVFCGTAVASDSASAGHYYAHPQNSFWRFLHEAGFTPRQLRPDEDQIVLDYGIGLTDLEKEITQSHDRGLNFSGASQVASHIENAAPAWIAFNGKRAGKDAASALGHGVPRLGVAQWTIGISQTFMAAKQ